MSAKLKVLVVDDSPFFCRRIKEILSASDRIEVVGMAHDGLEAVSQCRKLSPDVITMDVEMPVMDGISAVRRIMSVQPTRILMLSSVTNAGAQETLEALDAGAVDFLPKQYQPNNAFCDQYKLEHVLVERVLEVGRSSLLGPVAKAAAANAPVGKVVSLAKTRVRSMQLGKLPRLIAMGASTGGPLALQQVLESLPADFPVPIIMAVHMPGNFTPAYAERLNSVCEIEVREAHSGDLLTPGLALLAPGGKQLVVEQDHGRPVARVLEGGADQTYRPSVDILLGSAARLYPGNVLGIVLTGMGSDGLRGAQILKTSGSRMWTQDEASCVVYGMPKSIEEAGLSDQTLALSDIGPMLKRLSG